MTNSIEAANPTVMKVYDKGVPAHAQVFVDPEKQLVVDFLNDDGVVVNTAIYDRNDVEAIAERYGCDIKRVSSRISETDDADSVTVTETGQGADSDYKPLAEMEAEAVAARGDDEEPEAEGLAALSDEELYEVAQKHDIKGRTKMERAELIEAIEAVTDKADRSKAEIYEEAQAHDIEGRSSMDKEELADAVDKADKEAKE